MSILHKTWRYLTDPQYRLTVNVDKGFYDHLPDEEFLKRKFLSRQEMELNLEHPSTYNEKLQWLKLHDRKERYTTMVDKYASKQYAADRIGAEYIIPTLGVWERFEDIDFDLLPDQFVLKCTHDSGGIVICRDQSAFDYEAARRTIERSLARNYYSVGREWPYKNVPPRILAEQYLVDHSGAANQDQERGLADYKIYTIHGKALFCMINQDRARKTRADYFDRDFQWLDFTWGYEHAETRPEKPANYELMYTLAEKLAEDTYELRVDFYEVDGRVYFGEMTFFDGNGFDRIVPREWDYKLGSMLHLPEGESD